MQEYQPLVHLDVYDAQEIIVKAECWTKRREENVEEDVAECKQVEHQNRDSNKNREEKLWLQISQVKLVLIIFPTLFYFNSRFKSRNAKRRLSAIVPGSNQFTMINIFTAIFSNQLE